MVRDIILPAARVTWQKKSLLLIAVLTTTTFTLANEWVTAVKTLFAMLDPTTHFAALSSIAIALSEENISIGNVIKTSLNQPIEMIVALLSFAVIAALIIFFIWITANAQAITIAETSEKKVATKTSLSEALRNSTTHWQNLAIVNVSFNLVRLFVITIFLIIIIRINNELVAVLYAIAALAVTILFMVYSFIVRFTTMYIVLDGKNIRGAIRKSKLLFKKNKMVAFELSLLVAFVITTIVGIAGALLLQIFPEEEFGLSIINILLFREGWATFIQGLLFLLIIFIVGGVVSLFQYAVWVKWFERKERTPHSYINKIFGILKR